MAASAAPLEPSAAPRPELVRALHTKDVALITIGSVLGSAIFIAAADVPRAVPHPLLVVAVWVAGGLLTLAGCLAYAELGAMYPRSGGPYQYLKEAYGPFPAFLYGWTSFLVILSGGIASLGVAFGEYLGAFAPVFSTRNVLVELPLGALTWRMTGGQVAAALAIAFLTAVNYIGLKEGAGLQNAVTVVKVASLLALAGLGLLAPAPAGNDWMPPVAVAPAAIGVALIAVLWSYDGWYCATFSAGETVDAGRSLPRGLLWGIAGLVVLYTATNVVYLRALPVADMASATRVGEAAALALFGPGGGRLLALAVVVSTFGCLSSNILTCARVYQPMAEDGLFFRRLAAIHPRHRTPAASLVAQGAWSCVLAFTGSYEQLYTYCVFAGFLFHAATGVALFRLRRTQPHAPRPYRTWGYPWLPALFVLVSAAFVVNTLFERPTESLWGLGLMAVGVPAYLVWRGRR
jgi:APA family basic amino acid/polyamine antiporter